MSHPRSELKLVDSRSEADAFACLGLMVVTHVLGAVWSVLESAGVATRKLPSAQIKAFTANQGTRAKTDRIDAELIPRFMALRPDAGRTPPNEKIRLIRALTSKRGQLVETRKRLLAQIKAHGELGSADMFEAMDADLKGPLDRQIAELEAQIEQTIASDAELATHESSSQSQTQYPNLGKNGNLSPLEKYSC